MTAAAPSSLDLAIVSYRSRELLRRCLDSLERFGPACSLTVTVVDNDSQDGTVELLEQRFPWVDLVPAGGNLGFAAATNIAVRRGSAPFVLVLNPDTELVEDVLDRLLALMWEHPEVGICGCRLVRDDGSFDHAARRSFPTPLGALAHFARIGRWRRAPRALAQYRAPQIELGPVDAVNGAFMLIRRAALEQVGLFDEGYWMFMEDLDLCYRFRQAGWVTWYEPSATVLHVKGGSGDRRASPKLLCAFHYGMLRFYRKHYAAERSFLLNGLVYAGIGAKLALALAWTAPARLLARSAPAGAAGRDPEATDAGTV
ncbi:MAG: glycosyltransferase family 2 protein [Gaiellaceae bacterium]